MWAGPDSRQTLPTALPRPAEWAPGVLLLRSRWAEGCPKLADLEASPWDLVLRLWAIGWPQPHSLSPRPSSPISPSSPRCPSAPEPWALDKYSHVPGMALRSDGFGFGDLLVTLEIIAFTKGGQPGSPSGLKP